MTMTMKKQSAKDKNNNNQDILSLLFNGFDGGGTLAISMHKSLICSSARQGSVQVWVLDNGGGGDAQLQIMPQGTMKALEGTVVTCLELDDEYLWVGTADGRVQAYSYSSSTMPLTLQTKPELEWSFDGNAILSLSLTPNLGYGVVCTSNNDVHMFSMDDDDEEDVFSWKPQRLTMNGFDHAQTATLVESSQGGAALVCGTKDGALIVQHVDLETNYEPKMIEHDYVMQPQHTGPIQCLTSPTPGLLITGGQDGCIRMWNVGEDETYYLYQFIGYKVWLGSMWTDGKRLLSDGADNTIVLHDFSNQIDRNGLEDELMDIFADEDDDEDDFYDDFDGDEEDDEDGDY